MFRSSCSRTRQWKTASPRVPEQTRRREDRSAETAARNAGIGDSPEVSRSKPFNSLRAPSNRSKSRTKLDRLDEVGAIRNTRRSSGRNRSHFENSGLRCQSTADVWNDLRPLRTQRRDNRRYAVLLARRGRCSLGRRPDRNRRALAPSRPRARAPRGAPPRRFPAEEYV
jgi:hypothetical protein